MDELPLISRVSHNYWFYMLVDANDIAYLYIYILHTIGSIYIYIYYILHIYIYVGNIYYNTNICDIFYIDIAIAIAWIWCVASVYIYMYVWRIWVDITLPKNTVSWVCDSPTGLPPAVKIRLCWLLNSSNVNNSNIPTCTQWFLQKCIYICIYTPQNPTQQSMFSTDAAVLVITIGCPVSHGHWRWFSLRF